MSRWNVLMLLLAMGLAPGSGLSILARIGVVVEIPVPSLVELSLDLPPNALM